MIQYTAKNSAVTSLAQQVDASSTQISVVDQSVFPTPPFVIKIDDEIMLVTQVSDNILTVTRACESTASQAHSQGAKVKHVWTAGMYEQIRGLVNNLDTAPYLVNKFRGLFAPVLPEGAIAYFKNTLVDIVNGITPEGFEDSEETDYGLVSDPDGNIVVTRRVDDVPFSGVKSFAVEEGTTNLIPDGDFDTKTFQPPYNDAVNGTLEFVTTTLPNNNTGIALRLTNTTPADDSYEAYTFPYSGTDGALASAVEGDTFTVSAYIRGKTGSSIQLHLLWLDSEYHVVKDDEISRTGNDKWERFIVTATAPANTAYVAVRIDANNSGDVVDIWGWQLEKKPFATSFVDGSRPYGQLRIPISVLPEEGVISFWYKINSPSPVEMNRYAYIVASYPGSTYLIDKSFYWFGQQVTPDYTYEVVTKYDDGSGNVLEHRTSYIETPYKWRFATILYSISEEWIRILVDGEQIAYHTDFHGFAGPNFLFGRAEGNDDDHSIFFANIYIGSSKDSTGNLIWTDDYIKMLYTLQKPFVK